MKLCGKLFEVTEKPPQPEEPAIPPRPGRPGRSGSYLSFSKMIVVLILLTVTKSKVLIFSDIFFTYISIILHVFTIFLYNNTRSCDSKGRTDDDFLKCKRGFTYKYKYTFNFNFSIYFLIFNEFFTWSTTKGWWVGATLCLFNFLYANLRKIFAVQKSQGGRGGSCPAQAPPPTDATCLHNFSKESTNDGIWNKYVGNDTLDPPLL